MTRRGWLGGIHVGWTAQWNVFDARLPTCSLDHACTKLPLQPRRFRQDTQGMCLARVLFGASRDAWLWGIRDVRGDGGA